MSRKTWSSGGYRGRPTSNNGHSMAETDRCVIFFNVKFTEGYCIFVFILIQIFQKGKTMKNQFARQQKLKFFQA